MACESVTVSDVTEDVEFKRQVSTSLTHWKLCFWSRNMTIAHAHTHTHTLAHINTHTHTHTQKHTLAHINTPVHTDIHRDTELGRSVLYCVVQCEFPVHSGSSHQVAVCNSVT